MPDIHCLLLAGSYTESERERVVNAAGAREVIEAEPADARAVDRGLSRADVAALPGDLPEAAFTSGKLRWAHCGHAGVERSARPELFERGVRLSSAAGRSALVLPEHPLFCILSLTYGARRLLRAQDDRSSDLVRAETLRALKGQTLGVIGLGHTGSALAVRAGALGLRVVGYRRRARPLPAGVEHVWALDAGDTVHPLLETSDFVVLAASLNDGSHGLLDTAAFAAMKPGARLINVARGALVDEPALVRALQEEHLAGAGLDTFAVEPLPASSPLWDLPNVLITPHQTPPLPEREDRALEILCENLRRYRRGEPLRNELTAEDAYSAGLPARPDGWLQRLRRRLVRLGR